LPVHDISLSYRARLACGPIGSPGTACTARYGLAGVFAFPIGAPQPITSGWYWALLGFDLAMRVRNAVWRPPLVMYYRTCPLRAARNDLTASGFTVTTLPLTALGRREDGSPRYRLVLARRAF
jgi:hypothetical protein